VSWLNSTFEAAMPGMLRELGAVDVTLRRPHTLADREEPRIVDSLVLAAAALTGATSLSLRLADSGGLSGVLPAGLVFTIAGEEYFAAADAAAVNNVVSVTIAEPGLIDDAVLGAAVTLAAEVELSFPVTQGGGLKQDLSSRETPPHLVGQVSARLCLARSGAPGTPAKGMLVEFPDGTTLRVVEIERDWEGGWDLLLGAG
jgi:hypothetical protein